ncbi:hypothetical protein [Kitasatospora sp. NPDC056184]|uniref:hypothetical protein n=1 Tax=Kitasatospora sp. NPDC056184 TaxID=3345738 RepID=UPI0035DDC59E
MSDQYRVLMAEFRSGVIWAELPVSELQFTTILNAPGSATFTLPLAGTPLVGLPFSALSPWRTLIFVQRGRQILWGGPLITYRVDMEKEELQLSCEGLWSYYRRRVINWHYLATKRDELVIARELLMRFADGQGARLDGQQPDQRWWDLGAPYGNGVGALTFDMNARSGVLRDRTYWRYEWRSVGEAVEQLAAIRSNPFSPTPNIPGGFDFRIDHRWEGTKIRNDFNFLVPVLGQESGIVLEHRANCDVVNISVDGTAMTTAATVTGAGEGHDQLVNWWYNRDLEEDPNRRIPRLYQVESHANVTEIDTINGYARKLISQGQTPITIPSVRLIPGLYPSVSDIRVGELVEVRAKTPNWPGLSGKYKVMQMSAKAGEGAEDVTLELCPAEVFTYVGTDDPQPGW